MVTTPNDTDVLIAGAGPVGLFLANECARRGLRCRIVEEHSGQSEYSKALAIFPRTLEVFDMAGIVAPFLERANRVTSVRITTHDRTLAHMLFQPDDTPYRFVAMVPQNITESLLVEELRRRGESVQYDTRLISAEPRGDGDAVTAIVEHKGQTSRLTAAFLVGCDGAHSVVRRAANIPLEGGDYHLPFMLADVETNRELPADELQLCPNEFGPVAIFPMSAGRRRIVAAVDQLEGEAPSLDLVRRILRQRAPAGIEALSLHWSSYFRIHHRHAPHLRAGRMFLAGDAAHIHSPFGGQGMNTGLQDAWNLVWKLDLFLHGRGNEELLASYSTERIPVIRSVIETTDFLTKAMSTPNQIAQAVRDHVLPLVSRLAPVQHAFVKRLSELGIAYRGSPIVEGPGERYFDASMGGGGMGSRFLLLVGDGAAGEEAKEFCESRADVVELRRWKGPGMQLVRPDGYVAYAAKTGNVSGAMGHVRSILEKQTRSEGGGVLVAKPL